MSGKSSSEKKNWLQRNIIENHWLRVILEIIAFILLLSKLIPAKWYENGWPFLILISIVLIGLLITNFLLTNRLVKFASNYAADLNEKLAPLEKKARYADVLTIFNDAFQELHNAIRRDYTDVSKYHEPFMTFCNRLENAFNHITGHKCHVCIKTTVFPNNGIPTANRMHKLLNGLQVKTYCRSSSAVSVRRQIDQKTDIQHFINDNTDFESIYKRAEDCFYCDDLAELEEYKNSSFKSKNTDSSVFFSRGVSLEDKIRRWPLSYRTTIVVPIVPLVKENKEEHSAIGILCVDCETPYVFNQKIDKDIMIGCADGIYNSFKKLFAKSSTTD